MKTHSTGRARLRLAVVLAIAVFVVVAGSAPAQISLWYKEVIHQGTIYVFNTADVFKAWEKSREIKGGITKKAYGPSGETVVFENETALDLYNLKHNKEPEARPAPKPAAPPLPTRLRIGNNGELWFGGLFQAWYVGDTSERGSGTSWLGNNTGQNTFRLRRAEMKMSGKWKDFGFDVMIDPAKAISPQTSGTDGKILQELAVSFSGLKNHEFALGQKKITITEEGMRSSSELWFGERAQVTRAFADIRQGGFFYKGEFGKYVTLWSALTTGTLTNTISDTNDTLFYSGRLDFRPMKGLVIGTSGGTGETEGGTAHRNRSRWGGHVKYGGYDVPGSKLWLEFEYLAANDTQTNLTKLERWGLYASALYILGENFQVGFRYDRLNNNRNVPRNNSTMYTTGLHWLPLGKNLNVKLEWYNIDVEGRTVNGVSRCCYNQFLLAAQASF